jgi:hypothetical protein
MSNAELIDHVRNGLDAFMRDDLDLLLAKRLEESDGKNRWIPVKERMPTKEDADEDGYVLASATENESPHRKFSYMKKWYRLNEPTYYLTITHWQRITPPEAP